MKNIRLFFAAFLVALAIVPVNGQVIERVDPPSWFTDMKNGALTAHGLWKGNFCIRC